MAKQSKLRPIHLIQLFLQCDCRAVCNRFIEVEPIEAIIKYRSNGYYHSKGTFTPKGVTCKRCLKHPDYKKAMDRIKYPLFFLKDGV